MLSRYVLGRLGAAVRASFELEDTVLLELLKETKIGGSREGMPDGHGSPTKRANNKV